MYDESKANYFGIPRYYGASLSSTVDNLELDISYGLPAEHKFTSKLRDNQVPLYTEFVEAVADGKTGFILKARTASGKTVLLLKFLEHLGRNALVIVPTTSLLEQWKEMIVEHTAYSKSDIGHVQAAIGLIQSVHRDKYGEDFRKHFGIIVCDELHHTGAEHFSTVVSMFPAMYRIGASGTVSRQDGMDIVFRNHFGEVIISLGDEREEEVRPKILVIGYKGAKQFIPGWTYGLPKIRKRGVIISALAKDNTRNNILISNIMKLALSGRRILVLSDRIEQLQYLLDRTDSAYKPGLFVSATSKVDKSEILENSGIIYATFGLFSTGMDVPDLAGLVFATPQSRVRQAVGRISRLYKGKKRPVILDIVDNDIPECLNWYRSRMSEYRHPDIRGDVIVT
jgi:superfamily II DNA or RNA helicase